MIRLLSRSSSRSGLLGGTIRIGLVFVLVCALFGSLLLAGCAAEEAAESTTSEEAATTGETILTIEGLEETAELTMEDIEGLESIKAYGGWITTTGSITIPAEYTAVELTTLCDLVGGVSEGQAISVVAEDGYEMTFSYAQLTDAEFVTYDTSTGDEKADAAGPLTLALAYSRDGGALDEKEDGTLRVGIFGPEPDSVTDGHWWVKWVSKIVIKDSGEDWVLNMTGVVDDDIDRGSFESCSAPGCHGVSWVDEDGDEWTGVPLWLLMGRVDDENKHDDFAYDRELAEAGYTIELVAADGYKVTLDSSVAHGDDEVIVAVRLNGEDLPEEDGPLKLVGPNLSGKEKISNIVAINLVQ